MFMNGNINEAVLHYEAALKKDPTNAEVSNLKRLKYCIN